METQVILDSFSGFSYIDNDFDLNCGMSMGGIR